jgi:hypothetical protein
MQLLCVVHLPCSAEKSPGSVFMCTLCFSIARLFVSLGSIISLLLGVQHSQLV